MKKALLFLISIMLFLCSCTQNKERPYDPHNNDIPTYKINRQDTEDMAKDILTYLDNKDRDSIKALFAPQIADDYDLDSQIDKVFEIYDGTSISYEIGTCGVRAKYLKDRRVPYLVFDCEVEDIQTDNDKTFCIYIIRCIVDDENPDMIGITKIYLKDGEYNNLRIIGKYNNNEKELAE